jgi:N-acetylglucosaminyldiphosphoundecaprenol N-acetyl-beta-D-mannosaminyltransferase
MGGIVANRAFSMTNSQGNFARTGASAFGGEFTSPSGANGAERPVIENGALSARPTACDRVNILGVGAMPLELGKAVAMLEQWRIERRREYVCLISVHGLVVAQREPTVRNALNRCGLAAEDGMPLVWWSRLAGFSQARRVCGSDLLDEVCAYGVPRKYRHYFYGGSPRVLKLLVDRLQRRHPFLIVAGYRSPPFRPLTSAEDAEDIAAINEARPDFVWVGLGMPKQERWMVEHLGKIDATALLGVGAAFDFHAGTKPRAPIWMQRSGLEWVFRLMSEPRRLAHRYLIDNALFIGYTLQHVTRWKAYEQDW